MLDLTAVEEALHRIYIAADDTGLRKEDRKKAVEIAALLGEVETAIAGVKRRPVRIVDAAAGKAYVGLLTVELLLAPKGRAAHVTLIEREPARIAACRNAIGRLQLDAQVALVEADVADANAWPEAPDLVVALHACGSASDYVIDRAVACSARRLLLVPCCTSKAVSADALAKQHAETLGLPRHAEIRRRFIQALVDAERTLRLEAAGCETTVVAFVAPTVTPHHLLWRARRVCESGRMAEAAARLRRLRNPSP
jgi:hypothetical protein